MIKKKSPSPVRDALRNVVKHEPSPLAKRLGRKVKPEPIIHENPVDEVRRLIQRHQALTAATQSMRGMARDRKNRTTGEIIPCAMAAHNRADVNNAADGLAKEASRLEASIEKTLSSIPIYREFLSKVYGLGAVVCGYLVAMVRIERDPNVSQLIRYCGNGCNAEGKAERGKATPKAIGGPGTYNAVLKTRVWQGLIAMRKNASKFTVCEKHEDVRPKKGTQAQKAAFRTLTLACAACRKTDRPNGSETKYTRRWGEGLHAALTFPNVRLGRIMTAAEANEKGRRKATDLLLWDLYVMWRTLDGLDIRADKYSAIRGRFHNGQEANEQRYALTLEEAKEIVGDPSGKPATSWIWPIKADAEDGEDEDVEDVAAE